VESINSKSEYGNPKQIRNSNVQNPQTWQRHGTQDSVRHENILVIWICVIRYCFEPIKRAHSPLLAAGLGSVYNISIVPYGRRFPAACCRVFNFVIRYSDFSPAKDNDYVGPFQGPSSSRRFYRWSLTYISFLSALMQDDTPSLRKKKTTYLLKKELFCDIL